jgi:putative acetyltransferase
MPVTPAVRIRRALPGDIDAIYRTHCDSVEKLCGGEYDARQIAMWMDGRSPAGYLDAIARGELWVAELDGIVGFAEIEGNEMSKLFVAGDHSGQQIGARLLDCALAAIAAGGASHARLEATLTAVPFYERQGFRRTGTGYFSRGNSTVRIEIVQMEKSLVA